LAGTLNTARAFGNPKVSTELRDFLPYMAHCHAGVASGLAGKIKVRCGTSE
jgi:hypothetical protein